MSRRTPKPALAPEPAPRPLRECDVAFVAALHQAADHLVLRGEPEPGLPSIVRIAAGIVEEYYATRPRIEDQR